MKKLACAGILLFCVVLIIARFTTRKVEAQSSGCSDQALALAEGQLTDTVAYTSTSQFPVSTNPGNGNEWSLAAPSYWTSGFFPGELWIMYEKTLSSSWLNFTDDGLLERFTNVRKTCEHAVKAKSCARIACQEHLVASPD